MVRKQFFSDADDLMESLITVGNICKNYSDNLTRITLSCTQFKTELSTIKWGPSEITAYVEVFSILQMKCT